jgi:hypothetical protein
VRPSESVTAHWKGTAKAMLGKAQYHAPAGPRQ